MRGSRDVAGKTPTNADYSRREVEAGHRLSSAWRFTVEHEINRMVQSGTFQRVFNHDTYSEMAAGAADIRGEVGEGTQLGRYEGERANDRQSGSPMRGIYQGHPAPRALHLPEHDGGACLLGGRDAESGHAVHRHGPSFPPADYRLAEYMGPDGPRAQGRCGIP